MTITCELFGTIQEAASDVPKDVFKYTLSSARVVVKVISYGATINRIQVADKDGKFDEVALGFDSIEDCVRHNYVGSTIGRVANRIHEGRFRLNGKDHELTINNNANHLHGGIKGWDKCIWQSFVDGDRLVFTLQSADGDQGYPANVFAQVSYRLENGGSLRIDYQAMADAPTPINMTNHAFFNLAGHASGQKGLFEHEVEVCADRYLPVSEDLIPTGQLASVEGNAFDLRKSKNVGDALSTGPDGGFDHSFCITNKTRGILQKAATFTHPPSGNI